MRRRSGFQTGRYGTRSAWKAGTPGPAVVARGLSNDLAVWRNLWTDGEDLAVHAREFIANHLHATRATRADR
jgi:hypothetical protein